MLTWNGLKWARDAEKAPRQPKYGHFSPSGNISLHHLPGFLKRWLLKICPFLPERHRNRGFLTPNNLETTRKKKEKGGERGEKKKGLLALILFVLATLERYWKGSSSAEVRLFFTIWQHFLATSTRIFEKVAPEDLTNLATKKSSTQPIRRSVAPNVLEFENSKLKTDTCSWGALVWWSLSTWNSSYNFPSVH